MNRRSFLAALGAVAVAPVAALAPAPTSAPLRVVDPVTGISMRLVQHWPPAAPITFHRDAIRGFDALYGVGIEHALDCDVPAKELADRIDAMALQHVTVEIDGRFDDEETR